MIVVLTEYGKSYNDIAEVTLPIFKRYCKKHGYVFVVCPIEDETKWAYKKHEYIQKLFEDKRFTACWYLDIDAVITNHNYKVEDFMDTEHDFFITKDFNELNGGSIVIKNNDFGIGFNEYILRKRNVFENEQNVINARWDRYKNIIKILPHPSINSYNYSLYPECASYVGREDLGDWREGNFVLHVPGLGLEKRIEILKNIKI